ncbi:MAG: N-6 DNA methylase [Actinomycetia bacterium]|nr:N-6 DNA methylase [Actinomycetes bacterium]
MTKKVPIGRAEVEQHLKALEFTPGPTSETWTREFEEGAFSISVSLAGQGKIQYPTGIKIGRATTTNLVSAENAVILDCVCRLLAQGYAPEDLELERPFRLGRKDGYLDVLVLQEGKVFMMIECKTLGEEYESELKRLTTSPTGQVLSYYLADRDARYLILYSAGFNGKTLTTEYAAFETVGLVGGNLKALYESWDRKTFSTGLFDGSPYALTETPLKVSDLEDLTQKDGQALFNQFNEVLRRHAVSDKPNAFNKIFNLFICKVQDEEKDDPDEEIDFQWLNNESDETALDRLSDLYRRGMHDYLEIDTADIESDQVKAELTDVTPAQRSQVLALFKRIRQLKNSDFAFVEVYNNETYSRNAEIVRDIVRLFQRKRIRYTQKHGFMSVFFEKLLSTSVKQESGQFFTPTPIAEFICGSLPVESMIQSKIIDGDDNFLPYIIDFAAGSGHFITEMMERIEKVLQTLKPADMKKKTQKTKLATWSNALQWASEFVYGIELDYRLAKTAKVSCFLNGDGDANVIHGDGLGHFHHDPNFARVGGKIWKPALDGQFDLGNFDILVANPPYSVPDFKRNVRHGVESFEVFDEISDTSKSIEVLFVERMKHLLAPHGVAGIVLPTSILSNGGVDRHARRLLLRHFDLVSVVSLGSKTFIATGTPTSILFLRKRNSKEVTDLDQVVSDFIAGGSDKTVRGTKNALASYAEEVHGLGVDQYRSALKAPHTSPGRIFEEYVWEYEHGRKKSRDAFDGDGDPVDSFLEFVTDFERARMTGYLTGIGQTVLLVNAPSDTKAEKDFLGYEVTARRRHEGIVFTSGEADIETPMFDPSDVSNTNKINTLIRSNFESPLETIPSELNEFCAIVELHDLLSLTRATFDYTIATSPPRILQPFISRTVKLGTLCDIAIGGTPSRQRPKLFRNGTNLWVSVGELKRNTITETNEMITDDAVNESNVKLVKKGTLLVSFKLSLGKWAVAGADLYTNEAIAALSIKDKPPTTTEWVDREYLAALIDLFPEEILRFDDKGAKKIGKSANTADLRKLDIPVMSDVDRKKVTAVFEGTSSRDEKRANIGALLWGQTG